MKNKNIVSKLVFIGAVILVLLVANVVIGSKITDRKNVYEGAVADINSSAGGTFNSEGFAIEIPYEVYNTNYLGERTTKQKDGVYRIYPESVDYECSFSSEKRTLGIYSSPVFTGLLNVNASFKNVTLPQNTPSTIYYTEKAYLIYKISDRNIMERPVFNVNKTENETYYKNNGICCNLANYVVKPISEYKISASFKIRGAENMNFWLNSSSTTLAINGDWASPGFTGYSYLPDERTLSEDGFSAVWNIPFDAGDGSHSIGFNFIQPVNLYMKLQRANTYAFLFIIVPFIVLFMFEIFASINLHPVNYLLSGAASVLFFLLLLSLSEHISFISSYIIGAIASGVLVSLYTALITKKYKLGAVMAGIFVILYGYLLGCLQSEDYALLMGSIFAFVVLAVIMFMTSKIDWSNLKKMEHADLIES
ncbi:MAG: inner membrane CreD family protein [Spirochaetaceae bacterium]|nr:inner membrane CreD family protein [Spirochaetaceae bacterium]